MENVKKFYKDTYGEDVPKRFDEMNSDFLLEFAKNYSNEQLILYGVSNNPVAVCGDLSFNCRFRKGENCFSIDECSLKMEQTDY